MIRRVATAESVFPAKYRMIDVGPELLYHVEHAVQAHLRSPTLVGFHPRVGFCRVIRVADACGRPGPNDLRQIESALSRVGPGDEQSGYRVTGPLNQSAFAHGVISRVFSRHDWNDCFRHVVLYTAVGKVVPVVFAVALSALPKGWLRLAGHVNSREPCH